MMTAVLLAGISPRSATIWVVLFSMGYALRSFESFCKHHPPIPKRDPEATKRMVRWMMADARKEVDHARA